MQTQFSGNVFVYTGHINNTKKPNCVASERATQQEYIRGAVSDHIKADVKPVTDSIDVFYFEEPQDYVKNKINDKTKKESIVKASFKKWMTAHMVPFVEIDGPELNAEKAEGLALGLESEFDAYTQEINTLSREIARKSSPSIRTFNMDRDTAIKASLRHQAENSSDEQYRLLKMLERGMTQSKENADKLIDTLKNDVNSARVSENLTNRNGKLYLEG